MAPGKERERKAAASEYLDLLNLEANDFVNMLEEVEKRPGAYSLSIKAEYREHFGVTAGQLGEVNRSFLYEHNSFTTHGCFGKGIQYYKEHITIGGQRRRKILLDSFFS